MTPRFRLGAEEDHSSGHAAQERQRHRRRSARDEHVGARARPAQQCRVPLRPPGDHPVITQQLLVVFFSSRENWKWLSSLAETRLASNAACHLAVACLQSQSLEEIGASLGQRVDEGDRVINRVIAHSHSLSV
jgi:hypothetical protein